MIASTLGNKIDALLKENGLKQADLAEYLGITRSSVNGWIKGKHAPCSEKLRQVADFFNVDVKWLKNNNKPYPPDNSFRRSFSEPKVLENPTSLHNAKERVREDQGVEMINENLFRINNPDLKALLEELAESSGEKSSQRILTLFGRLFKIMKDEI